MDQTKHYIVWGVGHELLAKQTQALVLKAQNYNPRILCELRAWLLRSWERGLKLSVTAVSSLYTGPNTHLHRTEQRDQLYGNVSYSVLFAAVKPMLQIMLMPGRENSVFR